MSVCCCLSVSPRVSGWLPTNEYPSPLLRSVHAAEQLRLTTGIASPLVWSLPLVGPPISPLQAPTSSPPVLVSPTPTTLSVSSPHCCCLLAGPPPPPPPTLSEHPSLSSSSKHQQEKYTLRQTSIINDLHPPPPPPPSASAPLVTSLSIISRHLRRQYEHML